MRDPARRHSLGARHSSIVEIEGRRRHRSSRVRSCPIMPILRHPSAVIAATVEKPVAEMDQLRAAEIVELAFEGFGVRPAGMPIRTRATFRFDFHTILLQHIAPEMTYLDLPCNVPKQSPVGVPAP